MTVCHFNTSQVCIIKIEVIKKDMLIQYSDKTTDNTRSQHDLASSSAEWLAAKSHNCQMLQSRMGQA